MEIPTADQRRVSLEQGAQILAPVLNPHGFKFRTVDFGRGSGGSYAHGEFVRDDRRLELHLRWSLGCVIYHFGPLSLQHDDYMRALLGRSRVGYFPGPHSDDPLAGFEELRRDLLEHCSDFLTGSAEQFLRCVEKHHRYDALSPWQKLEYGS